MAEVTATNSAEGGVKKSGRNLDSKAEPEKEKEAVSKTNKKSRGYAGRRKFASKREEKQSSFRVTTANVSTDGTGLDLEVDQLQHQRDMKSRSSLQKSSKKEEGKSKECMDANSEEVLAIKGNQRSTKVQRLGSVEDRGRNKAFVQKGSAVDGTKQKSSLRKLHGKALAKGKPKPQKQSGNTSSANKDGISTSTTEGKTLFDTGNPVMVGTRNVKKQKQKTVPQQVAKQNGAVNKESSVSATGTKGSKKEPSDARAKDAKHVAAEKEGSKARTVAKVKKKAHSSYKPATIENLKGQITSQFQSSNPIGGNMQVSNHSKSKEMKDHEGKERVEQMKRKTSFAGCDPEVGNFSQAKSLIQVSKQNENAKEKATGTGMTKEASKLKATTHKTEISRGEATQTKSNQMKAKKQPTSQDNQIKNETRRRETTKSNPSRSGQKFEMRRDKKTMNIPARKPIQKQKKKSFLFSHDSISELKKSSVSEVVKILNKNIRILKNVLKVEQGKRIEQELLCNITCLLAKVCDATPAESIIHILATIKNTPFLSTHIKEFLQQIQTNNTSISDTRLEQFFSETLCILSAFLRRFPSSYAELDVPLEMFQDTLQQVNVENKEEHERRLAAILRKRDGIKETKNKRQAKPFHQQLNQEAEPPNDYREIQICPTVAEVTTREKPFLRSNIKQGKYESTEHYLDVQFRLFREDFVAPLREGIREVTNQVPREKRNQNIKLYNDVQILSKEYSRSGITHKIKFDVSRFRQTNWAVSKRLIFGSFLCLSRDNFKSMMFATVVNRDLPELRGGRVEIKFIEGQDVTGIENRNERFTVAESPAFFEAYRHVLVGLQVLNEENLPFRKYLVECRSDVDPPLYLCRQENQKPVMYQIDKSLGLSTEQRDVEASHPNLGKLERRRMKTQPRLQPTQIYVLKTDAWPSADKFPLNVSQLEALQTALTTEFSVIQGPPGTGKTYIGLKIVETLMDNRRCWDPYRSSPMLMVCFTNHALDQFLEGVLEFLPQGIIRVGGRSKSEKLENFNLKKFVRYRECGPIYDRMKHQKKCILDCKNRAEHPEEEILNLEEIESFIYEDLIDNLYFGKPNAHSVIGNMTKHFEVWLCSKENDLEPGEYMDEEVEEDDDDTDEEEDEEEEDEEEEEEEEEDDDEGEVEQEENEREEETEVAGNENKEVVVEDKTDKNHTGKDCRDLFAAAALLCKASASTADALTSSLLICENEAHITNSQQYASNDSNEISIPFSDSEPVVAPQETIDVEQEADRLQQERCIEGDEDAFLPIRIKEEELLAVNEESEEEPEAEQPVQSAFDQSASQITRRCRVKIRVMPADRKKVQNLISQGIPALTEKEVAEVQDVWNLSELDRIRMYLFWLTCYKEHWRQEMEEEEGSYEDLVRRLEDARARAQLRALSNAKVIGMTTTGAARYHEILQEIGPKIVVIEEAAEVLEAHILTSLTQDTEHVILIGDHKQLRPKPTVYELAQKYNLEISLFERMVLNKMDCKQLSTQHRMRPKIARLTKRIYQNEIFDHESVHHFADIRGIEKNLFFVDHREPENMVQGLQSYSNQHEADFVVALSRYLLFQGYDKTKLTVLTMYSGQLLELKGKMPKKEFEGVRVSVVDNFQGEENDIIILSLVRSTKDGKIGFLKEDNRICVALSRARKGFYCIGNFDLLSRKSITWRNIVEDLKLEDEVGETLRLKCSRHGNIMDVKQAEDFRKTPLGGCGLPCEETLKCGHVCRLTCHGYDTDHVQYTCKELCPERCPQGHPCFSQRCHYDSDCPPCLIEATKQCLNCGEDVETTCGCPVANLKCMRPCGKVLSCTHECQRLCFECCDSTFCAVMMLRSLSCEHSKMIPCGKDPADVKCNERCTRILQCYHQCPGKCFDDCTLQMCNEKVLKLLDCGHEVTVLCCDKETPVECQLPCNKYLLCNHKCPGKCYQDCSQFLCTIQVELDLPCGHVESRACHESNSNRKCSVPVQVTMSECLHDVEVECWKNVSTLVCPNPCTSMRICNHPCLEICGVPCELTPCRHVVNKMLPCGHNKNVACHVAADNAVCDTRVPVELPGCDHVKELLCSEAVDVRSGDVVVTCDVIVMKTLPCTHREKLPCGQEVDGVRCTRPCERMLSCGIHRCPGICGLDCTKTECSVQVWKALPCQERHRVSVPCHVSVDEITCREKCSRRLQCGHNCMGDCGIMCSEYKCSVIEQKILSCPKKHVVHLPCHVNSDTVVCREKCERKMDCGHQCKGPCGLKCDPSRCSVRVEKTLPCRHESRIPCGRLPTQWHCRIIMWKLLPCNHWGQTQCNRPVATVLCRATCGADLPCGHECTGVCGSCQKMGIHDVCLSRCTRTLVCSHPCLAVCSEPCPPCNKRCERACVHRCCQKRCSDSCDPCKLSCDNSCPHGKCSNACYELCTKPPCDKACPKYLSCGHPCIGLCGEVCPKLCRICNARAVAAITPSGKDSSDVKFIELFDCGHVVDLEKMNQLMEPSPSPGSSPGRPSQLQIKSCPTCAIPIRFSFRYERTVKHITSIIEEIKFSASRTRKGITEDICRLLQVIKLSKEARYKMQFPIAIRFSGSRDGPPEITATTRATSFLPVLRNHLLVLKVLFQARDLIERVVPRHGVHQSQEENVEMVLLPSYRLLSNYLQQMEARLMVPIVQLETIRLVHDHVLKLMLLSHILLAKYHTLQSSANLHLAGEVVMTRVVTQARMTNNGPRRTGMYTFLTSLSWTELREAAKEVRRGSGYLIPTEPSQVKFTSFPGLSLETWVTCDRDHVFPVEQVSCPRCTSANEAAD